MANSSTTSQKRKGKAARRGRPLYHDEVKVPLNLTLTPRSRFYLQLMARHADSSMSMVIEEVVAKMVQLNAPLRPLQRGSKRAGSKAMRGQAIHYGERKQPVNLSVTPATKKQLKRLAQVASDPAVKPSISDLMERYLICMSELMACFPYPGE